ncbi:hypothetical protein CISIN_1g023959mg [Citrus sinensis]|uniref:RRM domain-containing protein n=1 Tax=Citrus sinensis TaxID=2711 RepID=A0A067EC94_CITSI|nr:hypothetical protein CISIN_1g023959mg [Citrus sinensis]
MFDMSEAEQQSRNKMVLVSDTTSTTTTSKYSKIFVGGLAWETRTETMKHYFEQFGDILEAVVITDRVTGKSKGYGFVTFKDPESARRACENPYPVIDGRRANCNLAHLGAHHKKRPPLLHGNVTAAEPSTVDFGQPPVPQYAFSYSTYGYPTFSQNINHSMNYYNAYYGGLGQGQQQFSSYYHPNRFRFPGAGAYTNYHPFPLYLYTQAPVPAPAQAEQQQSSPNQHPKMVHFPYFPQHFPSSLTVTENVAAGAMQPGTRTGTGTTSLRDNTKG